MTILPGYYSRKEAANALGVSPQRISEIAKRDDWATYQVGRSKLYIARDVEISLLKLEAQKAWAMLGIPHHLWGAWWLADTDEIDAFECPSCSQAAYSPAGDTKWSEMAACPSCGWKN